MDAEVDANLRYGRRQSFYGEERNALFCGRFAGFALDVSAMKAYNQK